MLSVLLASASLDHWAPTMHVELFIECVFSLFLHLILFIKMNGLLIQDFQLAVE